MPDQWPRGYRAKDVNNSSTWTDTLRNRDETTREPHGAPGGGHRGGGSCGRVAPGLEGAACRGKSGASTGSSGSRCACIRSRVRLPHRHRDSVTKRPHQQPSAFEHHQNILASFASSVITLPSETLTREGLREIVEPRRDETRPVCLIE